MRAAALGERIAAQRLSHAGGMKPPTPQVCSLAKSRTSWVIFKLQNLGPPMLQKCVGLAPSAGSVWS